MSEYRVASRYAQALLDLAIEQKSLERVKQDVEAFLSVLKGHSELRALLVNPIVNHEKKTAILHAIFGEQFHPIVLGFFRLMVSKGRADVLYATAQRFVDVYNTYKKIVIAKVVSATALSAESSKAITHLIAEATGSEVVLEHSVNPDLLGGFLVTVDDKQIDATLLGRLNRLERTFLSA